MAEIVNLRTHRKRKAREDKDRRAEENRLLHGRTRGERQRTEAETAKQSSGLDQHLREKSEADDRQ